MNNMIEAAKKDVKEIIMGALGRLIAEEKLPSEPIPAFTVEIPKDNSHGDFSCNAALVSAKAFKSNPRNIATLISEAAVLDGTLFEKIEVAGPGFINLFLNPLWFGETVNKVIELKEKYGKTNLSAFIPLSVRE